MKKLNKGDKIYLDKEQTKESRVNTFLKCRDGIVEVYEYSEDSGYGSEARIFLCEDAKLEAIAIIRQVWNEFSEKWIEDAIFFDSDSFDYLKGLITCNYEVMGGEYTEVRDYNKEQGHR